VPQNVHPEPLRGCPQPPDVHASCWCGDRAIQGALVQLAPGVRAAARRYDRTARGAEARPGVQAVGDQVDVASRQKPRKLRSPL
jgi:hypothetical protein